MPGWELDWREETDRRIGLVRAAKVEKLRRTAVANLTPDELDVLLPPVECARTRIRLQGREETL
jgi:hypothetical protein